MVQLALFRTDPGLAFAHLKDWCLSAAYCGMSFSCVVCCCLIIVLFITHLFFSFTNLLFTCLLNTCSLFCCWFLVPRIFVVLLYLISSLFTQLFIAHSMLPACMLLNYLFCAYLIKLLVHLVVPPYSNRILLWFMSKVLIFCSTFVRIIWRSLLLFSYTVSLSKPLLSDSDSDS